MGPDPVPERPKRRRRPAASCAQEECGDGGASSSESSIFRCLTSEVIFCSVACHCSQNARPICPSKSDEYGEEDGEEEEDEAEDDGAAAGGGGGL